MKASLFTLSALFALAFLGCDKVETPIPKPDIIEVPIDTNNEISFPTVDSANLNRSFKKTFVEEMTGHKCITCPANTKLLIQQLNANKDRMIVVAVHAGSFAKVEPPDYPTNFKTEYGDTLFGFYDLSTFPIPSASVNRRTFPNFDDLMFFNQPSQFWDEPIDYENTNTDTDFALGVEADFIDSLGIFYIRISTEVLETTTENHRLLVLCIEDSVVAPQLDGQADANVYPKKIVTDYIHRHVLRARLNADLSIAGDRFIDAGTAAGEWIDYTLNAYMPSNVVNPENTHIVAVLVNDVTLEVVQSEETHVHVK